MSEFVDLYLHNAFWFSVITVFGILFIGVIVVAAKDIRDNW